MLSRGHLPRSSRAAQPESFGGSQDKAEQFIQSVHFVVTMQINMFMDERMKILYAVLYHPSSGWVSIAFRQDPSHSDDDITQYMW